MTTESLCTINNNYSNNTTKQKQDQREQKQTIGRITKGFKNSSREVEAAASSLSENEAQISTKTSNNIKSERSYFPVQGDRVVDSNNNKVNFEERSTFIDSRSILTNKENLKKFWEHKMEMDIKLRQEQQEMSLKQQKVVSFDSNNNSSSASNNEEANNIGKQRLSDEDWRSISPDEEPSKNDINNSNDCNKLNSHNNKKRRQQVSAKLICEKLRDYQAADEATLAERRAEKLERSNVAAKDVMLLRGKQNGFDSNDLQVENSNQDYKLDKDEVGDDNAESKFESNVPKNTNGHNDEVQLMSIDPTLCHSSENIIINNNNNNNDNNNNNISANNNKNDTLPASSIGHRTENTNDSIMNFNEREEQTANEEFSSSNSSFGPMSMSMPQQDDFISDNQLKLDLSNNQDQVSDIEDEPNSTQSGSVLTVINTKLDQNNKSSNNKNISFLNDNQKSLSWNGSSMDQNTLTSESIDELEVEESNSQDSDENEDKDKDRDINDGQEEEKEVNGDDEEESGSNIGVAFESLHFDNDIKSSKQEQVDDELLIAPTPIKRPTVSKFNANEVRSVCNFISAAISDASRQVENYINIGMHQELRGVSTKKDDQLMKDVISDNGHINKNTVDQEESIKNSSSSIQRATFVRESPDFINSASSMLTTNEDQELVNAQSNQVISEQSGLIKSERLELNSLQNDKRETDEDEEIPTADLSSIFEANVRREIERFETNSTVKKSNGCGKYANKNSLTEWRIAEEIRLFNAREMELKKRFEDTQSRSFGAGNGNGGGGDINNSSLSSSSSNSNQQMANVMDLKLSSSPSAAARQNQQHESVVRFGKTLQLPKASSSTDSNSTSMNTLSKSIKLSTTATSSTTNGNGQQTTMISMHKFIASGGKRFVFTNTNSSSSNQISSNTTAAPTFTTTALQNNLFTKSMSNLSTSNRTNDSATRVVDYKAVDSLKCKETPNVEPGIARKVIETFSRMQSSQDSLSSRANELQSAVTSTPTTITAAAVSATRQYIPPQQHMSTPSCLSNSAEWKIQEELREMRAREAELRDQRNHMVNSSLQISHTTTNHQDDLSSSNSLCSGREATDSSEHHLNFDSTISGTKQVLDQDDQNAHSREPLNLSFSSECLYPIKQTIDSFRKMNSSSQQQAITTNNNFSMLTTTATSHQNNNYLAKIQKKSVQTTRPEQQNNISSDDYDSKVGGQRRKISMIEKWENKMY